MKNCMYNIVRAIIHNTQHSTNTASRKRKREKAHSTHDRIGCCRVRSTSVIWDNRVMEINSAGRLLCGIFTC